MTFEAKDGISWNYSYNGWDRVPKYLHVDGKTFEFAYISDPIPFHLATLYLETQGFTWHQAHDYVWSLKYFPKSSTTRTI